MNYDMREDQLHVLHQIVSYARKENPDAVLLSGDLFDRAQPSGEAIAIFDHFISSLKEAVPEVSILMIAGNHDSPQRIGLYSRILERQKIYAVGSLAGREEDDSNPPKKQEADDSSLLRGTDSQSPSDSRGADSSSPDVSARPTLPQIPKVVLEDQWGVVNFYLLPFTSPCMLRGVSEKEPLSYDRAVHLLLSSLDLNLEERNVLLSHQFYLPHGASVEEIERSESEIRTVGNIDEVDAEVLSAFDYAALGHIHKPTLLGSPHIRYSGTPLPTSLSEAGQKKGVVMVELGEKNPINGTSSRITILPLTPLREIRKLQGGLQEVLKQRCDDYVSVLLTDSFALRLSETFATPAEASASPASKSSPAEAGAMETEASVSGYYDCRQALREAFPHLLEINFPSTDAKLLSDLEEESPLEDPLSLCESFLHLNNPETDPDTDSETRKLLTAIINQVTTNR